MKRWLLPRYQGSKLAPFPFKDPVNPALTISGYLGGGLHSHVFEAELEAELAERGCDDWCRLDRHQRKPIMGNVEELLDPRLPHFTPKHYDRIRRAEPEAAMVPSSSGNGPSHAESAFGEEPPSKFSYGLSTASQQ